MNIPATTDENATGKEKACTSEKSINKFCSFPNASSKQDGMSIIPCVFSFVFIVSVVVVLLLFPLGGCGFLVLFQPLICWGVAPTGGAPTRAPVCPVEIGMSSG